MVRPGATVIMFAVRRTATKKLYQLRWACQVAIVLSGILPPCRPLRRLSPARKSMRWSGLQCPRMSACYARR